MTDNLSNNIPTPFTPSGNPSVLPDSPPPQEVAVNPIPPLPSMSVSAANPPSKFGDPEPKVETVIEPDPPKPLEKPVTPPIPPPPSVPEENPAIRPPGTQSAVGDKSGDPYVKKHSSLPKVTIAGIASLVFLVVALGSGLYLTRQKQEVRTLASNCGCAPDYGHGSCGLNKDTIGNIDCDGQGANKKGWANACCDKAGGGSGGGGGGLAPTDSPGHVIVSYFCSTCQPGGICQENFTMGNAGFGNPCSQVDEVDSNGNFIKIVKLCDDSCSGGGGPTSPPGGPTEPPAPTTPATISANCQSLVGQISDGSGGWVTRADADFAAQARPGDRVRFVCTGHKTQGNFTKAAFFINGTLHVDDVVKLNADQYAVEYTIPAAGSLEVESVLLHDTKGWVD